MTAAASEKIALLDRAFAKKEGVRPQAIRANQPVIPSVNFGPLYTSAPLFALHYGLARALTTALNSSGSSILNFVQCPRSIL
jgi:hypothetical protein